MLMAFLGIGGLYGAVMLIADPSGKMIGLDEQLLASTPFNNYLGPGIILFIFNGLFPVFIFIALLRRLNWNRADAINIYKDQEWPWTFSLYAGIILLTWMNVQILLIGCSGAIQGWYGLLGIMILVLTLSPPVKKYYSRIL